MDRLPVGQGRASTHGLVARHPVCPGGWVYEPERVLASVEQPRVVRVGAHHQSIDECLRALDLLVLARDQADFEQSRLGVHGPSPSADPNPGPIPFGPNPSE